MKRGFTILAMLAATLGWVSMFTPDVRAAVDWEIGRAWQTAETPVAMARSGDGRWTFVLTAGHQVLVMGEEGRQEAAIPVADSITAIEVSAAGDQLFLLDPQRREIQTVSLTFAKDIEISGSPFLGMAKAPVTIVVFSDFQCPYCAKLVEVMEEVLDLYPESVKIVFKNFPLASHQLAEPAARAALAAANQGKFWPYHDLLFENYRTFTATQLLEFAGRLGLDLQQFSGDMISLGVRQQLARDIQEGRKAEVAGTPTVFVNGRLAKDKTVAGLRQIIDEELAGGAKKSGGNVER